MKLISEAFGHGDPIPRRFTCDGGNVSPPLRWSGAPAATKSFVVLCDDPEASEGAWRHWAAFDIPTYRTELLEGAGRPERFEDFRHAINDFGELGYGGAAPPHRHGVYYRFFRLLAVDRPELNIRAHPSCAEVDSKPASTFSRKPR